MNHRISNVLIVLSLLLALVSVAAAPRAAGAVTLIATGYVEGKGVVFTFHITGNVSKSDMKGGVTVDGGGHYGLDCVKVDSETVKCTAPKAVAGHDVTVIWGGSTFWTHVAGIPNPKAEYCYSVWDWWDFTNNEWTDFGPHCQGEPANPGDVITYEVPDPAGTFESWAEFYDVDVTNYCPSPVPYNGPAFYYPSCPESY